MTDTLADIVTGIEPQTGEPIAAIGEDTYGDLGALIDAFPALDAAENAGHLARLYAHFARPRGYRVIDDPAGFEAAYRAQIASEDPSEPWRQGVNRLVDFGMPDFSAIHAPRRAGDALAFFAADEMTGLPYRVTGRPRDPASAQFDPMPLAPVPALQRSDEEATEDAEAPPLERAEPDTDFDVPESDLPEDDDL